MEAEELTATDGTKSRSSEFAKKAKETYGIDPYKLYTLSFAAERLSVNAITIRTWIKRGRVKGVRLPNREWRIPGMELIRLLDPEGEWSGAEQSEGGVPR